jgi:ribosomal protein S18 acetylase RimI-like enzyme
MEPSLEIAVASVRDAPEILILQRLAYQSEAAIYDDYTIAPLTQSLDEIETDLQRQLVLKASADGKIVGSVRGYERDGTCFIGRLIVHPDWQNQGIGTWLMHEIEVHFPRAQRFELFTGDKSKRNLYLYQKLGYHKFRTEQLTDRLAIVYLEKVAGKL